MQGSCECFAAFGGPDCSACGEGYVQSGGTCSRYVRIRLPYIALQDRAASVNVRVTELRVLTQSGASSYALAQSKQSMSSHQQISGFMSLVSLPKPCMHMKHAL